jgi:hypothetical protein
MRMMDKSSTTEFKTDQIVCLDFPRKRLRQGDNLYLFAEVIDTIAISSRCWVRPLAIARSNPESFELEFLHDLRNAAQLILPTALFRYALDTEVLPLISELFHPDKDSTLTLTAKQALHQFITDLCQPPSGN